MEKVDFNKTVNALGRETAVVESRAHEVSTRFQTLCTRTELLKLDILQRRLINRAKSLARQAGFESMSRDGKKLGVSLAAAIAGLALGAVLGRDGLSTVSGRISGFNGALEALGESRWAVSLDRDLLVTPRNRVTSERTWVTMESLLIAVEELRKKIQNGEECGSLSSTLEKLKRGHSKLDHLLPVSQWIAVPQKGGTIS